jgi:hypothetical protein
MQVQDLPPIGTIQAIPRKESPFDSECIAATTATALPASIALFQTYRTFQNAPGAIAGGGGNATAKQPDRDTNLSGATGALPQGYQLFWYEWRTSIHALDANLNTPGTCYVFEALQRVRRLGAVKYLATQNPLVTVSLADLISYIDSLFVSTTNEQQTVVTNSIGFRGGKTMTVGGKPYKINPTEQLSVSIFFPGSNSGYSQAFNPSTIGPTPVNYYATSYLDGVLLRATGA